jgi:hypothetical protein
MNFINQKRRKRAPEPGKIGEKKKKHKTKKKLKRKFR